MMIKVLLFSHTSTLLCLTDPTAWKVLRISGGNVGTSAAATYSARLAFGVRQSTNRNVTIPETHVEIGVSPSINL
ncbi:hypothetical protein RSAG8_07031, partial [Rhizoctonia solani AG-8 WAC10335]